LHYYKILFVTLDVELHITLYAKVDFFVK